MKTLIFSKISFVALLIASQNLFAASAPYLSCLRQANPPAANRSSIDWAYEEIEIHPPVHVGTNKWNLIVASGYFNLTDIGKVQADSFDVMVYGVNDPYEVVADKDDPYGRLKGELKNGQWQIRFKARNWAVEEPLNCRTFNGPGTFKPIER